MNKYVIATESCMDLSKEEREQYGLERPIPGVVIYPDGKDHDAAIDWDNIGYEQFYNDLDKNQAKYKTGLPNQFKIVSRLEEYLKQGIDVLAITLSSGMSGTYNAFINAKKELEEKYPERKVEVVDSRRYSSGISILCIYASKNREAGMSLEDNFKWLEEHKKCVHQIGILDNLFFLHRSGRISRAKAFFGNLAGVKPMADFSNETGMPAVLGNARGYKSAYKYIEEYVRQLIGSTENKVFVITQSLREPQAEEIKKAVLRVAPNSTVIISRMSQSNGVNVGPGLAAVFFMADKPVSKDCEEERKVLTQIMGK